MKKRILVGLLETVVEIVVIGILGAILGMVTNIFDDYMFLILFALAIVIRSTKTSRKKVLS